MPSSQSQSSREPSRGPDEFLTEPGPLSLKRENSAKSLHGQLYMQASGNVVLVRRRKKRSEESPMKQFARWFVDNQTAISVNLFSLLFLAHSFFPKLRAHTTKFFTLGHHNPATGKYGVGGDDGYLILFFIVLFTGLRASTMEYILSPLARIGGVSRKKGVTRFSEQAWLSIYYSLFWPLGLYIYCNSPYYMSLKNLWTDWPDREVDGLMKGYMLAQLAFWLQQILVINIEERRKDHWQMLTHHIITIALIFSCYRYHHTRVGNLVLVLMDISDLVFGIAKCLKYTGYSTLCDIAFGVFMLSWFVARHACYCMVCYSVWAQTPEILPTGCFRGRPGEVQGPVEPPASGLGYLLEPFTDSAGLVCYDQRVKWSFLSVLLFLQVIMVVWFFMIIQVAIRVIKGDGADDSRSDDEGEEEEDEEDEYVYEEAQPLEEDVGVDEIDLKGWERRAGVKRQASSATGVSLPGHSDRKELLGRIGCEKQVD